MFHSLTSKTPLNSVELDATRRPGAPSRVTTDCSGRNSGNGRYGHRYGTALTSAEKADLLEYLKTL